MNIIKELQKLGKEIHYLVEFPISAPKHHAAKSYANFGRVCTKPPINSPQAREKRRLKRKMSKKSRQQNRNK